MSGNYDGWSDWHRELMTHGRRRGSQTDSPDPPRQVPGGNLLFEPGSAGYEVALELGGRYGERLDYIRSVSPKEQVAKVNGPIL